MEEYDRLRNMRYSRPVYSDSSWLPLSSDKDALFF